MLKSQQYKLIFSFLIITAILAVFAIIVDIGFSVGNSKQEHEYLQVRNSNQEQKYLQVSLNQEVIGIRIFGLSLNSNYFMTNSGTSTRNVTELILNYMYPTNGFQNCSVVNPCHVA